MKLYTYKLCRDCFEITVSETKVRETKFMYIEEDDCWISGLHVSKISKRILPHAPDDFTYITEEESLDEATKYFIKLRVSRIKSCEYDIEKLKQEIEKIVKKGIKE